MTKRFILLLLLGALISSTSLAQEPAKPESQSRQQRQPQRQPVVEVPAEPQAETESTDVAMRKVLTELSEQVGKLSVEIRKTRLDGERNSTMLELLLYEERQERIEGKLQDAINYKAQLDAQEADIQRRQRNIQQELTLRGGYALRREEAEAALKQELQRALDMIHNQQTQYQTRIADLQGQTDRLRARIEELRKKAERLEAKRESEQ